MSDAVAKDDWKTQYRTLLDELENKDNAWSEVEASLRSTASRLGIAAMGRSEVLDQQLQSIVDALHAPGEWQGAGLDDALETLSRTVIEQERAAPSGTSGPPIDLAGFVAKLPLPAAQQRRYLDELAQSSGTHPQQVLRDLANDISQLLSVSDDDAPGQTRAARQLVARLIKSAGQPLADTLTTLDEALRTGSSSVPDVLNELADAVVTTLSDVQTQKTELESFLEQITERLADVESFASASQNDAVERRADTDALGEDVASHMHELRDAVTTDDGDVAHIKSRVEKRLDAIARNIQTFREREETRAAAAEERSKVLQEQVNRLRVRTTDLARRCGDQEHRLMHDSLTGVHTRYAYDRRLQEEFQRWQRHGLPLSYSIWDIDLFKNVNDTFGHQAGDGLLAAVAGLLQQETRTEDFVARLGGEEFVVVFVGTSLDAAHALVERLRVAIANASFEHEGSPVPVTISCGLTEFRPNDTPKTVYERADAALYEAKKAGRNRSVRR